jgi:hypothetical protein
MNVKELQHNLHARNDDGSMATAIAAILIKALEVVERARDVQCASCTGLLGEGFDEALAAFDFLLAQP